MKQPLEIQSRGDHHIKDTIVFVRFLTTCRSKYICSRTNV